MKTTEGGRRLYRYRNRKNGVTDHIIVGNQEDTLCNHLTIPLTDDGTVNRKRVMPIRSINNRDNWCNSCRRKYENLDTDNQQVDH